jgi:hypothetical protein
MKADPSYARVAIYVYRPGKREEGDRVVKEFIDEGATGLKGHLIFDDLDNPDKAAYVTLWDSEESMVNYFGSIRRDLDDAMDALTLGATEYLFTTIRDASM